MLEACNSGVAASLPIMVIFAKEERGALLVKVRERGAAERRARRVRKEDILRLLGAKRDGWVLWISLLSGIVDVVL